MAKKRDPLNDPASVESMYDQLKGDTGHMNSSFYRRMMSNVLYRLCLNRIEWRGLPRGIDSALVEQQLIRGYTLSIYQSGTVSDPILYRAVGSGRLNNQGLPSEWFLKSLNFVDFYNNIPFSKLAILDPRHERLQVTAIIAYYADLFDDFDKALKSNLKMQKTPALVIADQELQLTMSNIIDQYNSGAPTIYTFKDNGLNPAESLTALNFNVDYVGDRLLIDRRQAWNDCMTYLGIDNSNQDKRERLVRAEISGNDEQIDAARLVDLEPRRKFARELNARYNLNMEVNWKTDWESANNTLELTDELNAEVDAQTDDSSSTQSRINVTQ